MTTTSDNDLHALLERLEAHWRQQRVPILDVLLPGLSDGEIVDLVGPLGIQLPDELRTWWRWHGGVPTSARRAAQIGPGWEYTTLEDAARLCQRNRSIADRDVLSPDRWWLDSWLPVAASVVPPLLTADCSGPPDAPAPILVVSPATDPTYFTPKAPSFTSVVAIWVDAFDTGLISYNAERGEWHRGDVPIELDRLLL